MIGVLCLGVMLATEAADAVGTSETIAFKNQKPFFESGKLLAHADEALQTQAKRVGGTQLTVVVCVGDERAPSGGAIREAGERAVVKVREAVPSASVTWVARELATEVCPMGLLLESWTAPPVAPQASVRVTSGTVFVQLAGGLAVDATGTTRVGVGGVLETRGDSRGVLLFTDGSLVSLAAGSRVTLVALEPEVRIEVERGRIEARRRSGSWRFLAGGTEVQAEAAHLMLGVETKPALLRLSVFEGGAVVQRGATKLPFGAGRGAVVQGDAITERALPLAPLNLRPARGDHPQPLKLVWEPIEGVKAYRVEVSSDLQFEKLASSARASGPELALKGLRPAEYFWRVIALGERDLESRPSARYRVRVQ